MKRIIMTSIFGLALAVVLGFGFIPATEQTASCADCDTENLPDIQKAFNAFAAECAKLVADGKEEPKKCFIPNTYNKLLPIMKVFAKDNRFGPGDRILFPGETQVGNLIAGANRTFQAGAPSAKDTMTIEITKTDGKNGALIKVCAVDDKGNVTRPAANIKFEENEANGTKSVVATGIQGKIIRIQIASFGGVAKNFKYSLKTSQ